MLFRSLCALILAFSLLACTEERIDSPRSRVGEGPDIVETKDITSQQYDAQVLELEKAITEGTFKEKKTALNEISDYIYGDNSLDPNFYSKDAYRARLLLVVKLVKIWRDENLLQAGPSIDSILTKFNEHFLVPCINQSGTNCVLVEDILKREASTQYLIVLIAKRSSDQKVRLDLLGLAFDVAGRRSNEELTRLYTDSVITLIKTNETEISEWKKRHLYNVSRLFEYTDWKQATTWQVDLFKRIKPWNFQGDKDTASNFLRSSLVKFIGYYYKRDVDVRKGVKENLDNVISRLQKDQYDLDSYPAFKGVKLNDGKKEFLDFLALKFFIGDFDISQLNEIYNQLSVHEQNIDRMFAIFRLAVRWKIAQLGLYSTEELSKKSKEFKFKSKSAIQAILDRGQDLVPLWSSFHGIQKAGIKDFLSSNIEQSKKYKPGDVDNFVQAIDRNIYRTVVYPNMLAVAYYMAQSEWEAEVRIWFWTVKINTVKVMDRLMTGQYPMPWFTFTDLKDLQNINGAYEHLVKADYKTRKTLYRSEIYDSLYYLFATKTHQAHNINPDPFFKLIYEKVANPRVEVLEDTLDVQNAVYMNKNSAVHQFLGWCEGLRNGAPTEEYLDFKEIFKRNVPFIQELQDVEGINGRALYYGDYYIDNRDQYSYNLNVINDRFRLEYLPIMEFVQHSQEIVRNLERENPGLIETDWTHTNQYVDFLENLQKAFLGSQVSLSKLMGDCQFIASEEAKRRSMEMAFAEKTYQEQIVYPVLKKVSLGEITHDQANNFFRRLHDNSPLYQDSVSPTGGQGVSLMLQTTTFGYRIKKFFQFGLRVNHPWTGMVEIKPIVGNHLKLVVPDGFMSNLPPQFKKTELKFISKSSKPFDYHPSISKEEFASSVVGSLFMHMRNRWEAGQEYLEWDFYSSREYAKSPQTYMQFYATFNQMGEFEHFDYDRDVCRSYIKEVPADCIVKSSFGLKDSADKINRWFNLVFLDQKDRDFLELIGEKEFMSREYIDFITQFEASLVIDDDQFNLTDLPYRELNGFFDLLYEMFNSEYLGWLFSTSIGSNMDSDEDSGGAADCWSRRRECNWSNERAYAREFHTSRLERAGLFYNFDKRILEREYAYNKSRVMTKYGLMRALEKHGDKLIKSVRGSNMTGMVHLEYGEDEIYNLSQSNSLTEKEFTEFFVEETGSFYLSEPDWESYLDPEVSWFKSK